MPPPRRLLPLEAGARGNPFAPMDLFRLAHLDWATEAVGQHRGRKGVAIETHMHTDVCQKDVQ